VAARRGARVAQHALGVSEEPPALGEQRLAGRRQLDAPAGSGQQADTELLLEPPDLVAERRLGDVQPCRRSSEMKLLGDGHEVLDEPEVKAFDRRNLLIVRQPVFD
jgi:hypothetical protein